MGTLPLKRDRIWRHLDPPRKEPTSPCNYPTVRVANQGAKIETDFATLCSFEGGFVVNEWGHGIACEDLTNRVERAAIRGRIVHRPPPV